MRLWRPSANPSLLVLDADLRVQRANRAFYQYFQVTPADTERRRIFELGEGQWNIPALRTLLEELLPTNHAFADYEVEHTFPGIDRRIMLLNAQRIDRVPLILLAMEDITERKRVEGEKQQILEQREEFMAIASRELKTPVTSLKGYAQLLQARFAKAGDERSAKALARMDAQRDKLIGPIVELLDVSSIDAGQLPWRTERFFRVSDPEHATFPGLGLGLFIEMLSDAGYEAEIEVNGQAVRQMVEPLPDLLLLDTPALRHGWAHHL